MDIRGRLFDFWGVYGWLQKNISCRLISRGKKHAKKFLGQTISCTEKNITHDVSNSRGLGKNYYLKITHTPLLHIRPMVMLTIRGWRKKRIWHLSKCHPSTNGWRALIKWWFSRLKFCISRLKIRQRNTQMERESSMECSVSFLWTNESFSLWNCLSKKSTLFLHGG